MVRARPPRVPANKSDAAGGRGRTTWPESLRCEPPGGVPEMGSLTGALRGLDADLFAMVELNLYPCHPDVPLPIARRTQKYYESIGVSD